VFLERRIEIVPRSDFEELAHVVLVLRILFMVKPNSLLQGIRDICIECI